VLAELEALGLLEGSEDFVHNVPISDRSKTAIEPLVSEQWFVRMQELAGPAIEAVRTGALKFKPERWTKVYLDWLENVHDWCISRQLWWGHRIPVWYDADGVPAASETDLALGAPHPTTGRPIVRQDEDVLDTWASSWLWPFATLGWPERTADLERFYPTQFLSTARDILYLWVARMVMAGYAFADHLPPQRRCPFAVCTIHATVLDGQGRRMSKSLGNGIDPVAMIEKYGADAVRYSLMILTREGQDVKLAENRFELGQRFCNKIWNAARFTLQNLAGEIAERPDESLEGRWIRARLAVLASEVTRALETYDFHDAATALYRFTWDDFCDWYLEAAKRRLRGDPAEAACVRRTLGEVLSALLRLLHPFTPFLTEALWAEVPARFRLGADLLQTAPWPDQAGTPDATALADFERVQDAVRALRNVCALLEISPAERPAGLLRCADPAIARTLAGQAELVAWLARTGPLEVRADGDRPTAHGTDVFRGGAVFLPCPSGTDVGKLRASLAKKLEKVEQGVRGTEAKLVNERFLAAADPEVVTTERERLDGLRREAGTLRANLAEL
jgi:valyl-tRNA synthetase